MTDPQPHPDLAADLVAVARLRTGLPRGEPAEVRAFYPEDVEGLWSVPMFDGDRGRVVVVLAVDGEVVAHGGLARAADHLRSLLPDERFSLVDGPDWLADELTPVLDAVGGLCPGMPRYPDPRHSLRGDGGLDVTFEEPVAWVRFAAAGAEGPPPGESIGSGGITPPQEMGAMVCTVAADCTLAWRFEVGGTAVGHLAATPTPPAADEGADEAAGIEAEQAIATARTMVTSPLAMPSAPVVRLRSGGWRVELAGIGIVSVGAG